MNEIRPLLPHDVREALDAVAAASIGWEGPLPDGDLAEHLDSMDRLTLVVAIEDHFRVAFEPEDEEAVRTVDDVVRLVVGKLGAEVEARVG